MTDDEFGPEDILFLGHGPSHPAWYRCFQPAIALQADYLATIGEPPHDIHNIMGEVRGSPEVPEREIPGGYKIIVVQLVRGPKWKHWISEQQNKGVKVLYEIDDDVFAAGHLRKHPNAKLLKANAENYRMCLRQCDGIICSTPHLAHRMFQFNDTYICPVGLDLVRYQEFTKASYSNSKVTIGFAGALGHEESLDPWLPKIKAAVRKYPFVRYVSIGNDSAEKVGGEVQFATSIADYPAALSEFDIALAPGGTSDFYRCKGELKWTEPGAMGIPTIASPIPSTSIEHGKTGIHVANPEEFWQELQALIENAQRRWYIGHNAQTWVEINMPIQRRIGNWIDTFEDIL